MPADLSGETPHLRIAEQDAEDLAGAGVQGAWGVSPQIPRRPGREPSPKAACDVADVSPGGHSCPLVASPLRSFDFKFALLIAFPL